MEAGICAKQGKLEDVHVACKIEAAINKEIL